MQGVFFLLLICAGVGKCQGKRHFYSYFFSIYKPSKLSHVSKISVSGIKPNILRHRDAYDHMRPYFELPCK